MQLLLPTSKRNPAFTLLLSHDETHIHVYYGLERLEVVPVDPRHVAYKMLVARLYNAGVRVQSLTDVFEVDPKTMRAWGHALRSCDPALLQRMLLGPEAGRKRTAAIDAYVRLRWPQLLAEGCRNFRQTLQKDIETIFNIRLSGETLRHLMAQIRASPAPGAAAPPPDAGEEPAEEPQTQAADAADEAPCQETTPAFTDPAGVVPGEPGEVGQTTAFRESTCSVHAADEEYMEADLRSDSSVESATICCETAAAPEQAASKCIPSFFPRKPGTARLCDHAGMLLFADALGSLARAVEPPEPLLSQWLGSVLLGASNVEQTKYLNWEDLSLILGAVVRFPTTQREELQRLATPATVEAVLRWNLQQLGPAAEGTDLYLDPHTQHYTGMQPVLKGWCAALRRADKLLNSDFVHTAQGHPIYFECGDNYEDLRARFAPLIRRLRATLRWEPTRVLTFVVDRGIYGNEVFTQVLADPGVHLITWQKGYVAGPWDTAAVCGTYGLEKVRNNSRDVRLYQFSFIDGKSVEHEGLRQILVRATNPSGVIAQLAILTDDFTRPAAAVVRLIFSRWVQENDFKYLDKHFGINQITSYRSLPYEALRDGLSDRLVPSHAYVQKAKEGKVLLQRKSQVLAVSDQARRTEDERQRRIEELQKPPSLPLPETHPKVTADPSAAVPAATAATAASRARELSNLKNASKRFAKYQGGRQRTIDELHKKLVNNKDEKDAMEKEVSRIDQLVRQEMVRLDTGNKTFMDAIKITARNLFYRVFAPFKTAYNNYRDDHDYFRELTQSAGVLRWNGEEIEVHLVPQVNYAPKLRKIIGSLLQGLNETSPRLPDGSNRKLHLRLTLKGQIEVRVLDLPEG